MHGQRALTVWDQEELHYVAEEVIVRLHHGLYWYDDEGVSHWESL